MKKRVVAGALILAMLGLTACSGTGDPSEPSKTEDVSEIRKPEEANETEKAGEEADDSIKTEAGDTSAGDALTDDGTVLTSGPILEKYTWFDSVDNSDDLPEGDYDNYKNYGDIHIDSYGVFGDGYEALDKALFEEYEERKQGIQWFEDSISEAMAYEDEAGFPWPYEDDTTVYRSDEKVVSYLSNRYLYLGGAHGGTSVKGCNFDTDSGKRLAISDVVRDPDGMCDAVKEKLAPRADELFEEWEDTVYRDIHEGEAENGAFAWVLNKDSIEFVFGDYEIAPFAAGHIHVEIKDEEYPGLLNAEYLDEASLLVRHLTPFENTELDLDGDGEDELIRVEPQGQYNDEYGYNEYMKVKAVVVKDGKEIYSEELEDNDFSDAYIMENEDGLYFMYVEMQSDNDWHIVYAFDLNDPGKSIKNMGQCSAGAFYDFDPVDPETLVMGTRVNTMGTRSAYRICYVDEGGMIVPYDDEYYIRLYDDSRIYPEEDYDDYKYLHTAIDFTAYEDIDRTKAVIIPAKTRLCPLRTDDETYMVFSDESGKEYYVFYDEERPEDEWERFIDGHRETEIFEDVMYAG